MDASGIAVVCIILHPMKLSQLPLVGLRWEKHLGTVQISDTVVIKFGIPTLYNLCISALCANYDMEVIDKVISYLPRHVIADI